MNRQAIVGLFTLLGLVALFAILLVIRNVGTGGRYPIGVHFKSAAGLHRGALVYESGVVVGVVDETRLLPEDFTVEVILAINNNVDIPRDARFLIAAPLTGDATVEILPPVPQSRVGAVVGAAPPPASIALLPRQVLPIEQQPQGSNPATLSELLEQGQGEVHRLDRMLSLLEEREPKLLDSLQSTLNGANDLTTNGSKRLYEIADRVDRLTASLQTALDAGSGNLIDITRQLDADVRTSGPKVDRLLSQLNGTAVSLNETVDQVKSLASNPEVRKNLIDTTKGLAQTATTIGAITSDLHNVTSNPQTQAQLRDTVANVDAATQKLNSLLRQLGATSNVYGVDPGATPAPVPAGGISPYGHVPGGAPLPGSNLAAAPAAPAAAPVAGGTTSSAPAAGATPPPINAIRQRLSNAAKDLIALQIRLTELGPYDPSKFTQPLLATHDDGPQADFNLAVLPHGRMSLLAGANDVGTPQSSANFVLEQKMGSNLRVGGGMLYSNLGGLVQYTPPGLFGVEARVYDLRFPTVDAYGTLNLGNTVQLFGGERDITHAGRRSAFGLQLQF
jgi:ABC-type transporter Mla subunit MlaD